MIVLCDKVCLIVFCAFMDQMLDAGSSIKGQSSIFIQHQVSSIEDLAD